MTPTQTKHIERLELLEQALQASAEDRQDDAAVLAEAVIEAGDTDDRAAHFIIADTHASADNDKDAVRHYNTWLQRNCEHKDADNVRGLIVSRGGTPGC